MISKQQFIYRIRKEVFPELLSTEQERKKTLFLVCCCCLVTALLIYLFRNIILEYRSGGKLAGLLIAVCLISTAIIQGYFIDKQKDKFSPIFLSFLGDLKRRKSGVDSDLLKYSCLFSEFDSISYDDNISGVINDTKFFVSEVSMTHGSGKSKEYVFGGVCIHIPMNTSISGYTLLFNQKRSKNFPVLEKVSLEDVSFKNNYQVYSNNQIEARVLLTPSFMDKLNALKKVFKNKRVDVSFFGNHAVFAIHTSKDLFEPYSLLRSVTNIKTYERFYDEIRSVYDMVEVLKVNNHNESLSTDIHCNQELYYQISSIKRKKWKRLHILIFVTVILCAVAYAILRIWVEHY